MVLLARRLASTKASDSSNESCARMEAYKKEDSSGSEEASCCASELREAGWGGGLKRTVGPHDEVCRLRST